IADRKQQPAGNAQAAIDVEGSVQAGIIDEALPADRRPGFLEVHAHDDLEFAAETTTQATETSCILECSVWVVDRARTDGDHKTIIFARKNTVYGLARP